MSLTPADVAPADGERPYIWLSPDSLDPDPDNLMGEDVDQDDIDRLAASIDSWIGSAPLKVYPVEDNRYRIWLGQHRHAAARKAGAPGVLCHLVDPPGATERLTEQLRENLNRRHESPVVIARKIERLVTDEHLSTAAIAKLLGQSKSWVSRHQALLTMPPEVVQLVGSGTLSLMSIRALKRLPGDRVISVAQLAAAETWSASRLEEEVARIMNSYSTRPSSEPAARTDPAQLSDDGATPPARCPRQRPAGEEPAIVEVGAVEEEGSDLVVPRAPAAGGEDHYGHEAPAATQAQLVPPAPRPSPAAHADSERQRFVWWLTEQYDALVAQGQQPMCVLAVDADHVFQDAATEWPVAARQFVRSMTGASGEVPSDLTRGWNAAGAETRHALLSLMASAAGQIALQNLARGYASARDRLGPDVADAQLAGPLSPGWRRLEDGLGDAASVQNSSEQQLDTKPHRQPLDLEPGAIEDRLPQALDEHALQLRPPDRPGAGMSDTRAVGAAPPIGPPASELFAIPLFLNLNDASVRQLAVARYDPDNAPWSTTASGYRIPPWHLDARRFRLALHHARGVTEWTQLDANATSWETVDPDQVKREWVKVNQRLKDAVQRDGLLETCEGTFAYWVWLEMHHYPVLMFDRPPGTTETPRWSATPAQVWEQLPLRTNDEWILEAAAFLTAAETTIEWGWASDRTIDDIRERWQPANFFNPRHPDWRNDDRAWTAILERADALTEAAHDEMEVAIRALPEPLIESLGPKPTFLEGDAPADHGATHDGIESGARTLDDVGEAAHATANQGSLPHDVAHLFDGVTPIIVCLGELPITGGSHRRKRLFADADIATDVYRRSTTSPPVPPGVALSMHPDIPVTLVADIVSSAEDSAADIALCDLYGDVLSVPPDGWPATTATAALLPERIRVKQVDQPTTGQTPGKRSSRRGRALTSLLNLAS